MMLMAEHCGTHLDAPRHFDEHGLSVNEVSLDRLVLPGHLLDFTHKLNGEAITIADFEAAEVKSGTAIGPGTAVICWTGRDKTWGHGDWVKNRPFIPTITAQWLVDRGMTLFATDLIGHGRSRRVVVADSCRLAAEQHLHGATGPAILNAWWARSSCSFAYP